VLGLLLEKGADPTLRDARGRTPLQLSCGRGDEGCVTLLISRDPSLVNVADRQGNTPVHFAARHGHLDILELLKAAGGDLTAKGAGGM